MRIQPALGYAHYYISAIVEAVSRFKSQVSDVGSAELSFGTTLERQAFDISRAFSESSQFADLPLTAEPFEDLLEKCRANWGERPTIVAMGIAICEMPSKRGRKRLRAVGLFDLEKPLCDRIRTSRLRAKNAGWWREQMALSTKAIDRFLFHLTFWKWAPIGLYFELADELGRLLDELEGGEWKTLLEHMDTTQRGLFPPAIGTSQTPKLLPRPLPSQRLALLVGMRDQGEYGRAIFLEHLVNSSDGSLPMAVYRQVHAFEAALAGAFDWRSALSVIRATYVEDAAYPLSQIVTAKTRMPETVAQQVLNNARDYPVSLWSMAEGIANASARKTVRAVGRVAKADRWFPD
jgi:hypothetical protein